MSSISAGTTTGTALVSTGDTTGNLDLKINGSTQAVRVNTSGAIGVGTSPAFGTSGQVLTSAGSAAAPTWSTPAAGYTNADVLTLFSATGSAPVYAARAWVNFNGTGTSSVIAASGNVSSVTDLGTGNYILNFTTAMPDANYSVVGCGANNAVGYFAVIAGNETLNNTTTTAAVNTCSSVGVRYDGVSVFFVVFR
jgi:hypothetical protein